MEKRHTCKLVWFCVKDSTSVVCSCEGIWVWLYLQNASIMKKLEGVKHLHTKSTSEHHNHSVQKTQLAAVGLTLFLKRENIPPVYVSVCLWSCKICTPPGLSSSCSHACQDFLLMHSWPRPPCGWQLARLLSVLHTLPSLWWHWPL